MEADIKHVTRRTYVCHGGGRLTQGAAAAEVHRRTQSQHGTSDLYDNICQTLDVFSKLILYEFNIYEYMRRTFKSTFNNIE